MDASIPVANTGRSQLLDPHLKAGLIEAAGLIALGRSIDRKRATGSPFADLVARLQIADDLPGSTRPYIFRRMTSCSISLSRLRFATSRFSRTFSSSSTFRRFTHMTSTSGTVCLSEGVSARNKCNGFFIVHSHTTKCFANVFR